LKKILWKVIIFGGLASILVVFLFFKGYVRFNYPSFEEYPIQGIDISHHQGEIEWDKIPKENVSFVFMKATEGGDYVDPKFAENWKNARSRQFPVGAYHFYRLCKSGVEQANNFIATVPREDKQLPPVIDLEFGGNCETDKSEEQILREIQEFMELIQAHYGQTPIIYATKEFYEDYLQNRFKENPIWIRDIYRKPALVDEKEWILWQFANRGHLEGIDFYVDLNVFNGNREDFEEFVK
jgi:lysozyme